MNRKYVKEYEIIEDNGKKRTLYTGPVYVLDEAAGGGRRAGLRLLAAAVVMAAAYTGMGCAGVEATRKVYVGLPFTLMVVPVVYACVDAVRFLWHKGAMERVHYEGSFLHMFAWAFSVLVLSAAAFLGDVCWLFLTPEKNAGEFLFIPAALLLWLAAFYLLSQWRVIKTGITEIPGAAADKPEAPRAADNDELVEKS